MSSICRTWWPGGRVGPPSLVISLLGVAGAKASRQRQRAPGHVPRAHDRPRHAAGHARRGIAAQGHGPGARSASRRLAPAGWHAHVFVGMSESAAQYAGHAHEDVGMPPGRGLRIVEAPLTLRPFTAKFEEVAAGYRIVWITFRRSR